jgi:hypothetical protein
VRRLSAVAPFLTHALNYDGVTADSVIFFDATGFTGAHQVRIVDGGPPVRRAYHRLTAFITTSDADGFYRLPPLTRVGKIELAAKDSGSPAKGSVELVPDYTLPETQRDLTVS